MIEKKVYEELKERYGKYSSWAIWKEKGDTPKSNIDDLSIFEDESIHEKLNNDYVLIGLNAAKHDGKPEDMVDWRGFHSTDLRRTQDYKLRYVLIDTPYWGSYMTDLFKVWGKTDSKECEETDSKRCEKTNSREVINYFKKQEHKDEFDNNEFDNNVDMLKEELSILGGHPILIAFGDEVEKNLKAADFDKNYIIINVGHYSHRKYNNYKVDYKKSINDSLEEINKIKTNSNNNQ